MYIVYILECNDGTLYTGITTDIARRLKEHTEGIGSKYTKARGVRKVVYKEVCVNRSEASKREAEIKRLSRDEKIHLLTQRIKNGI